MCLLKSSTVAGILTPLISREKIYQMGYHMGQLRIYGSDKTSANAGQRNSVKIEVRKKNKTLL